MNEVTTGVLERPNMGRGGLSDAQGTQRRARTPVGRPLPFRGQASRRESIALPAVFWSPPICGCSAS